ncbi:MAG: hypothetical protein GYA33_12110, partial [Thermogutta sp.]|nr:hypothetical protein [Thermogutta sp.]
STGWGLILGLFSTWLMLLLPWLMTVHARLAVVLSTLQDLRRKLESLEARWEGRSGREAGSVQDRTVCRAVACPLAETTFSSALDEPPA